MAQDQVKASFAKLASHYETVVDEGSPYNADLERPAMMALLPEDLNGLKVLDAGCAAGWYTEQLARKGAQVTATDLSQEMVDAVKRRLGEQADVHCLDLAQPLPFEDGTFDVIVSSLTLHYIEDWGPTFAEFARVLKPGGMLLYSVHHPFMDFRMSVSQDYYGKELLHDTWKTSSGKVEVSFYRRPLQEILQETLRHFVIQTVEEPQPTERFREKLPERYEKQKKKPHFLIVQARQP